VPDPVIRRMQPEELPKVIEVWIRSQAELLSRLRAEQVYPPEEMRPWFRDVLSPSREIWVIERERRVAGLMAMNGSEIDRLYIDPDAQGEGLGTTLLELAKKLYPEGVHLVTHQINSGARRFYERHGFEAYEFGRSPAPEDEPDVWYRWPRHPKRAYATDSKM
jgi:ribosomal protein S18 acetylase RimI-like enzyme